MKCANARILIHLDREGERTPEESASLALHLQSCAACGAEADLVSRAKPMLARIVVATPLRSDSGPALDRIQRAVETRRLELPVIQRLLDWADEPAAQLSYGFLILALVSVFIFQTPPSPPSPMAYPAYSFVSYQLDLPSAQTLGAVVDDRIMDIAKAGSRRVEVRKSDVGRLLTLGEQQFIRMLGLPTEDQRRVENILLKLRTTITATIRVHA